MSYASELSRRLSERAEQVCRTYLPNGRRQGGYWTAGDVAGSKGRSLYVRLHGERAGKWTDAATGEHGDLLDLIALNCGFHTFRDTLEEARHFLGGPHRVRAELQQQLPMADVPAPRNSAAAVQWLYALSRPVPGTLAATYLRRRAITAPLDWSSLRFHPSCYYVPEGANERQQWPALLGVVTDLNGKLTGLHRTWLARDGSGKAPFDEPRRAKGRLLGNAVRFGKVADVMAAGEGIETVLSLLSLFPAMPMAAGLSVAHLCALAFPASLRRLYVLRENDAGGLSVERHLGQRCREDGIEFIPIRTAAKDLNDDLRAEPAEAVKARIADQLTAEDRLHFAGQMGTNSCNADCL